MVFAPCNRAKIVSTSFALFKLGSSCIQYVRKFKYLSRMLDEHLSDDDDDDDDVAYYGKLVICLLELMYYVRTSVLCRRFSRRFIIVKIQIFKSYCLCLYGTALWRCYKIATMNKLKSAYNRCLKS